MEILKQDFGPEHPTVLAMIAQHDKLYDQLNERLEGIKKGFEVEYAVAKARVDDLQKRYDDAKNASYALESDKYLPFRNAQREEWRCDLVVRAQRRRGGRQVLHDRQSRLRLRATRRPRARRR